jgi:polyisoprenoid-binding protein YceI
MKTKNLILGVFAATAILLASCSQGGQKQTAETSEATETKTTETTIDQVTVNPQESKVVWKGEMLGIYSHEGTLNLTQASIDMKEGTITGGSFTADMKSMVATDENYNPEEGSTPEKLIGHLSSPDFFDVENFPTAQFEIKGMEGNAVMGMLTIRGISNEEKVENVQMKKEGDKVKITGDLVFDRKKYNVSWDSPVKDRVLSNDIELKIELMGS